MALLDARTRRLSSSRCVLDTFTCRRRDIENIVTIRSVQFVTANTSDGSRTEHLKRMFESRFVLTVNVFIGAYWPIFS